MTTTITSKASAMEIHNRIHQIEELEYVKGINELKEFFDSGYHGVGLQGTIITEHHFTEFNQKYITFTTRNGTRTFRYIGRLHALIKYMEKYQIVQSITKQIWHTDHVI